MLDMKRLRVLKEVAHQGSFSAAGEALGYTQSAVSQQIAALERETGTMLVARGARGVPLRLTDAGRALVDHADGILARMAAAEEELEAIAGLRGGRLRLASFPTAGATLVPLAIAEFSRRHPGVELSLVEAEVEESIPRLKSGELDVALIFEYSSLPRSYYEDDVADVERVHLLDDPMYLALPPDHPLARKRSLRLEDLSTDAWVQGDCNGSCGAMHIAACEAAGFEPRVAFETDDYNVVQGLVAAGVAVSLIAELALANVRDDIVIRSLGRAAPIRHVHAATLASGYRAPATEAMLEVLEHASAEYARRRPGRLAAA
jgi:DNA-binding transcriptional LysR family regulator